VLTEVVGLVAVDVGRQWQGETGANDTIKYAVFTNNCTAGMGKGAGEAGAQQDKLVARVMPLEACRAQGSFAAPDRQQWAAGLLLSRKRTYTDTKNSISYAVPDVSCLGQPVGPRLQGARVPCLTYLAR